MKQLTPEYPVTTTHEQRPLTPHHPLLFVVVIFAYLENLEVDDRV